MQRSLSVCLAAVVSTAAIVSAQAPAPAITTVPAGYENVVGTTAGVRPFVFNDYHNQQIDDSLVGTALPNIVALNLRRDESATVDTSGVARTADVTIIMGHGSLETFSRVYAQNYKGASTTVFTKKQFSFPDLQNQTAAGGVEPWAIRFPLDNSFSYNGVDDLIIETIYEGASDAGSYQIDAVTMPGTDNAVAPLFNPRTGTGCFVTGRSALFRQSLSISYSLDGYKRLTLATKMEDGPADQVSIYSLGFATLPASGVLCADLVNPIVTIAGPTLDTNGGYSQVPSGRNYLNFPYQAGLIGGVVKFQLIALDPSASVPAKIALTDVADVTWPAPNPGASPAVSAVLYNGNDVTVPDGDIFDSRSIIWGLEQ